METKEAVRLLHDCVDRISFLRIQMETILRDQEVELTDTSSETYDAMKRYMMARNDLAEEKCAEIERELQQAEEYLEAI